MLAGIAATIKEEKDLFVEVVVNHASSAVTGDILLTADTGATIVKTKGWTYVAPGKVTEVKPNRGQVGSIVVISGTNLRSGGDAVKQITLGGVVVGIMTQSNTEVKVKVYPGKKVGKSDIVVTSSNGAYVVLANGWEYLDQGDINEVSPSSGQYGTQVSITGTGLLGGGSNITSLTLAGIAVKQIVKQTDKLIQVVVQVDKTNVSRSGDVVIQTDTGAVVSRLGGWRYLQQGSVASVTPSQGQIGTAVVIGGERMLGGGAKISSVRLGDTGATIDSSSDTTIKVVVARAKESGKEDVVVVANTGAVLTRKAAWQYLKEGVINKVEPNQGQRGTYVKITGERLQGGGETVNKVTLSNVEAELISFSDTSVSVRSRPGPAGNGHVVLLSDSGALVTLEDGWTFLAVGAVDTITPGIGQLNTVVTIAGARLFGGGNGIKTVTLSGLDAKVRSATNNQIVVVAPASTKSSGTRVTLLSSSGAIVEVDDKWAYASEGTVQSVSPKVGHFATRVTIKGSSLRGQGKRVVSLTLAGVTSKIVSESNSEVVVIAQPGSNITGDVVLTADTEATVTLNNGFSYAVGGDITSVVPNKGQLGTKVDIIGTGLRGAGKRIVGVTLSGTAAGKIVTETDTLVQVIIANASASSGAIELLADTGARVTGKPQWTYLEIGEVQSVIPNSGQLGTRVVIKGKRLLGGDDKLASATLCGKAATVTSASDTQVSVIVPDGPKAVGHVILTAVSGALVTLNNGFTCLARGGVSIASPSRGQLGTMVAIHGKALLGGGKSLVTVTLDGKAPYELMVISDTLIKLRAAESVQPGVGAIRIVSDTGSIVELPNGWTYDVPSNITDVCV